MIKKTKLFISSILIIIVIACLFLAPAFFSYRSTVKAISTLPYQIGLKNSLITKCVWQVYPPLCIAYGTDPIPAATAACNVKGQAVCNTYSYVSGVPAGGMGNGALFLTTVIGRIGLPVGGDLIAGGMSPVAMDGGVAASYGGTAYGVAKKVNDTINKFIIAVKGNKINEK